MATPTKESVAIKQKFDRTYALLEQAYKASEDLYKYIHTTGHALSLGAMNQLAKEVEQAARTARNIKNNLY